MVRNEAHNIARCIASIKRLKAIDEILILDTGSTDATPQIANDAGARVRLLENPDDYFIETKRGRYIDFSKARNESMVGASGDWILIVDADEDIVGDASTLKHILGQMEDDIEGVTLQFIDKQQGRDIMQFQQARIFRNGRIRWDGVVHNRPYFKQPAFFCPDIKLEIHHYGYDLTPEAEQKKWDRTVGLLEYRLEQNPDDAVPYFYLAQNYSQIKEHEKSVEFALKYIAARDTLDNFNLSIYFTLLMELKKLGDAEKMDTWLAQALKELPNDLDIAAAAIEYGEWQQKSVALKLGSEKFIRNYDALAANKLANGTRFVYSNNKYWLTRALFHFSLMSMHEGIRSLTRLYDDLKAMDDPKYVASVFDDIDRETRQMKLSDWRSVIGRGCKVVQLAKPEKKKKKKRK